MWEEKERHCWKLSQCYLSTTSASLACLFISTDKVAFCHESSMRISTQATCWGSFIGQSSSSIYINLFIFLCLFWCKICWSIEKYIWSCTAGCHSTEEDQVQWPKWKCSETRLLTVFISGFMGVLRYHNKTFKYLK